MANGVPLMRTIALCGMATTSPLMTGRCTVAPSRGIGETAKYVFQILCALSLDDRAPFWKWRKND